MSYAGKNMSAKPIIAIIGRPNVGKSSLFNRLLARRQAIISPVAGTTRDRLYGATLVGGLAVDIVDTAGLSTAMSTEHLGQAMINQAHQAAAEADLIIFVLDAQSGLTSDDQMLAEIIRRSSTPTVVLVNKVDDPNTNPDPALLSLGLGPVIVGSIVQRRGLDKLTTELKRLIQPTTGHYDDTGDCLPVALIGRPNVGKSTLFNALVGEERVIVSDVPGTTRDTIDSSIRFNDGECYLFTDTAGLRRRGKIGRQDKLEHYSVIRTMRAIDRAAVIILVVDAAEGLTRGDAHAASYALEQKKRLITVFNKSDLIDPRSVNTSRFPFIARQPMLFVSARERVAIEQLRELLTAVRHSLDERQDQSS